MQQFELLRERDFDRYFCTLFAPEPKREVLAALYLFNDEIVRAAETLTEPGLSLIRLQWWRDVLTGVRSGHADAARLRDYVAKGEIRLDSLLAMIAAHEQVCEAGIDDEAAWIAYLDARGGALLAEAGHILGDMSPHLVDIGCVYAGIAVLRSVEWAARHDKCFLPRNAVYHDDATPLSPPDHQAARQGLADLLRARLGARRRMGSVAGLIGILARRDLARHDQAPRARGLGDLLAVTIAAITKRI